MVPCGVRAGCDRFAMVGLRSVLNKHTNDNNDTDINTNDDNVDNNSNNNTVSFHNLKSQNFKLSVSNPKSKYVVYLSVPSRISNCQSLGRKNKHEIVKTDRKQTHKTTPNDKINKMNTIKR